MNGNIDLGPADRRSVEGLRAHSEEGGERQGGLAEAHPYRRLREHGAILGRARGRDAALDDAPTAKPDHLRDRRVGVRELIRTWPLLPVRVGYPSFDGQVDVRSARQGRRARRTG